jgi:hypothetical protein
VLKETQKKRIPLFNYYNHLITYLEHENGLKNYIPASKLIMAPEIQDPVGKNQLGVRASLRKSRTL